MSAPIIESSGMCPFCGRGIDTDERIASLEQENRSLREALRPVSDEVWATIEYAVNSLEIWFDGGYRNAEGATPMWNPTLRRLRNALNTHKEEVAARADAQGVTK
jgi:hypothetical protein